MLEVHASINGLWKEITYVVSDESGTAIIIDPGEDCRKIIDHVEKRRLRVKAILNTHAHFDHVSGVEELKKFFSVPFYLHSADSKLLKQANLYRLLFGGKNNIQIPLVAVDLMDVPEVRFKSLRLTVIPCPGHTQGGVAFLCGGKMFTGDNIIGKKIGRADLPGGDLEKLHLSFRGLLSHPPETEIYPGHGRMFLLREASQ